VNNPRLRGCRLGKRVLQMAQRKHSLAAIAGGQVIKPRAKAAVTPKSQLEDADHFITRDGLTFAGSHLIIDLWEAEGLNDKARIEKAMRDAVEAAGATLLHIHLHTFTPNGGVSGVAVLAESHISVHTWPEKGYAAFDVFMCGNAEPKKALKVLEQAFAPQRTVVGIHKRGVL